MRDNMKRAQIWKYLIDFGELTSFFVIIMLSLFVQGHLAS